MPCTGTNDFFLVINVKGDFISHIFIYIQVLGHEKPIQSTLSYFLLGDTTSEEKSLFRPFNKRVCKENGTCDFDVIKIEPSKIYMCNSTIASRKIKL